MNPPRVRRAAGQARAQRGVIALVLALVVVAAAAGLAIKYLSAFQAQKRQDEVNSQTLLQARDALAGWFTLTQRGSTGPYGLPCPDRTGNDGLADAPCTLPGQAIGRLPYRTLGLPDLRDASGEIPWYAVATTWGAAVTKPTTTSTTGMTVLDTDGGTLHPAGTQANAAAAIVFAPGGPLIRMGAAAMQARVGPPAAPNGIDYLDRCAPPLCAITEDNGDGLNSTFVASVVGNLTDGTNQLRFNDQLLVLTRGELCHDKRTGGGANAC